MDALRAGEISGNFGRHLAAFEAEFAAFCGAAHACAVANGTDALQLALRAYGIGPGDEVVTVALRGEPAKGMKAPRKQRTRKEEGAGAVTQGSPV